MTHCVSCDKELRPETAHYLVNDGPLCLLCFECRTYSAQQRKERTMQTDAITATEAEAIQAIVNRSALRIPTTNTVVFAGRLLRNPLIIGENGNLTAMFQVANEDPDHPAEAEVLMRGPAAEFCRSLFRSQAVVVHGRLDKKIVGERGTRIVATFIEPLQ